MSLLRKSYRFWTISFSLVLNIYYFCLEVLSTPSTVTVIFYLLHVDSTFSGLLGVNNNEQLLNLKCCRGQIRGKTISNYNP